MLLFPAMRAVMLHLPFQPHGIGQFGGEDAGRHGDDRVAGDHHQRGQHLTDGRLRRDVTEAHGGQRHHRPVDADRYAGEAVGRL